MRKILFSIVTLLALLLAVEVGLTLLSQHGMERALRSQYELPPSLEVNINSFPYLLSLARNHMGEVRMSWKGDLQYEVVDGALESIPYEGSVELYDVELDMPSLLTGRLEMKHISRQEATISIDLESLNQALATSGCSLELENERLYARFGGRKTRCMVKVSGDNSLEIAPYDAFSDSSGSYQDYDVGLETVIFEGLPMESILLNASTKPDMVVLEISIPMWEGYL